MEDVKNVLDQIHMHIAKTDNVDPLLQKEFSKLDKNIRAMNVLKNDSGTAELAELDKQARFLAARFETKHPHIGDLIRRLSTILQGMGI